MPEDLTIITPTGGRAGSFGLLCRWLRNQQFMGRAQWVVVDDCVPETAVEVDLPWLRVDVVRPRPAWRIGEITLARNLRLGLERRVCDRVLIMEDDDWYAPTYLAWMDTVLDTCDIVGEENCLYYHVPLGQYRYCNNTAHASLFQTGVNGGPAIDLLHQCAADGERWIDLALWTEARRRRLVAFIAPQPEYPQSMGMKGLPGRAGIGTGHRPRNVDHCWHKDQGGKLLREIMGADAEHYEQFRRQPV